MHHSIVPTRLASALLGFVLIAACGPTSPAPTAPVKQEAAPAVPAIVEAGPATGSGAQASWDEIVAAAKREGVLVYSTTTGTTWQRFYERVKQEFPWLEVQWTPMKPSDLSPRIISEQRNGVYAWDFYLGASANMLQVMTPAGALEPIMPFLDALPADVKDDSKWYGGFQLFTDPERPVTLLDHFNAGGGFHVNRDLVSAAEVSKWEDLLDPKWKDRIIAYDPTVGNAGSFAYAALLGPKGEDFVVKLLAQTKYIETRNQVTEWVAQGRYPIAIGVDENLLEEFQAKTIGKNVELVGRADGPTLTANGVSILKNAPHPNAVKVFMRWLLTAEGQDARASTTQANSRRVDVKTYDPATTPDYARLSEYPFRVGTTQGEATLRRALELTKR